MEATEIREAAVEVRENAETLVDGEVDALNDAKYLAAQVATLAHAVEELAKKLEMLGGGA
jgi:ubiquinone biosynthesis protein UbiJ